MREINIHNTGGSGPRGASAYARLRTGCLEKERLSALHLPTCDILYQPTPTGQPNAMLIGTMVHALIEEELKRAGADATTQAKFIDEKCAWTPPEAWQDEAHRIYSGWCKIREPWGDGKLYGSELMLEAELAPGIVAQAKIDHLREYNGVLTLEDFKTSSKSGDYYTMGQARLQQHLYCMIAWANGYDVQAIRIRQIIKTKEIREAIYTIDLPTPTREKWIIRYLQAANERSIIEPMGPWGAECDHCVFMKQGLCRL